tara:strand:+ start:1897 stop:2856 length:960 start_codon:yes stop_codon:yes gene_type:complete
MMQQVLLGQGGGGGGLDVDDVFNVELYTGNGSSRTITVSIDLTSGGMVWCKTRSNTTNHAVSSTALGTNKWQNSDNKTIVSSGSGISSFGNLTIQMGTSAPFNQNTYTYVAWSFKKEPKFFDCIKYTGNGSTQNISHSLDATPGFIITKPLDLTKNWHCWHSAINTDQYFTLDTTDGINNNEDLWNDTAPTSSQFTVGNNSATNGSSQEYIAYLFAEDTSNVIKCGSYTGTGSGNHTITTGFEVQWVLIKKSGTGSADWILVDSARGANKVLYPSDNKAEDTSTTVMQEFTSNGFKLGANSDVNQTNVEYIYVAIAAGS